MGRGRKAPAPNLMEGGDGYALVGARMGQRMEALGVVSPFWIVQGGFAAGRSAGGKSMGGMDDASLLGALLGPWSMGTSAYS